MHSRRKRSIATAPPSRATALAKTHFTALAIAVATALAACSATGDVARAANETADSSRAKVAASITPADTDDFGAPLPTDTTASARIVSLNPTATELLYAIGASARLVGRSAWDEFPAEVKSVASVGDGIRPNVEAVLAVRPTLVIMYGAAENRAAAAALQRAGVRTIALRVDHISEFMSLATRLGRAVGLEDRAALVRDSVQRTLDAVRAVTRGATPRRVVWPVWLSPTLVIGGGSFIDELITIAGGQNVFRESPAPSPPASIEEIARRDPEFVAVSESMRTRLENDVPWRAVRAVRERKWIITDPDLTGRPSVVLGMAAVELARALHPDRAAALPRR